MDEKEGEALPRPYTIGIDVSRWQKSVDWKMLYEKGVRFAVVKLSQGNYSKDAMAETHARGALDASMVVGLYHWHDPNCDVKSQIAHIQKSAGGIDFSFLAIDVEQYWQDWMEWQRNEITRKIPAAVISRSSLALAQGLRAIYSKKVAVYTRASFVHEHAAEMSTWLKDWELWLAHYPYKPGRISTSWETLKMQMLPTINTPLLPIGCKEWRMWQWSGDKFLLPGVSSAVDLNFFHGSENELRAWACLPGMEEKAMALDLESKVRILWNSHPELHKSEVKQ